MFTAAHLPEAWLVANLLQRAGIEVEIRNQYAQGGMGEIPFTHAWPEVWIVNDGERDRARALIADYEAGKDAETITQCRFCGEENPGNFDTCWQCGAALPKD